MDRARLDHMPDPGFQGASGGTSVFDLEMVGLIVWKVLKIHI